MRTMSTFAAALALGVLAACTPRPAPPPAPARPPASGLPGAPAFPEELSKALAALPRVADPHAVHRNADGTPTWTNRLALERSPYLLQHAHNPVDWMPWGEAAFERARREKKPVFLSVGYSTCHWCHVMAREDFEDLEVAQVLNEGFVAIKVDREERPDLDGIYMDAVQAFTGGGGGWPMSVFLTPSKEPFFAGTYIPKARFLPLLKELKGQFDSDPAGVAAKAGAIAERLREQGATSEAKSVAGAKPIRDAVTQLEGSADREYGGFGHGMKFPRTSALTLLFRYARRTNDAFAKEHALKTLSAMSAGGIHDQLGGGFHRYTTERTWLVPHFEKMLYDNALLTLAYLDGMQQKGAPDFRGDVDSTLEYLVREMRDPAGGFYSATDADSEGEEGKFFVWTAADFDRAAGPLAKDLRPYFGVTDAGNWEGRNILTRHDEHWPCPKGDDVSKALDRLRDARNKRVRPHLDDKVLAAWNGLTLSAFARAGFQLDAKRFTDRGVELANFLLTKMKRDGRLLAVWRKGEARQPAFLDDHAFVIQGLLDLFEATQDLRWLEEAKSLQAVLDAHFADPKGGYFFTADDAEKLIARQKPDYDGALPSGNSVEAMNLLRLSELTGDAAYREKAELLFAAFAPTLEASPSAMPAMLAALDFALDRPKEIVLVDPSRQRPLCKPGTTCLPLTDSVRLLETIRDTYAPNRVLVIAEEGESLNKLAQAIPFALERRAIQREPTAYVCEGKVCGLPTRDPKVLAKQLLKTAPLP